MERGRGGSLECSHCSRVPASLPFRDRHLDCLRMPHRQPTPLRLLTHSSGYPHHSLWLEGKGEGRDLWEAARCHAAHVREAVESNHCVCPGGGGQKVGVGHAPLLCG